MNRNSKANALQWGKEARRRVKLTAGTDKPVSFIKAYADARAESKAS